MNWNTWVTGVRRDSHGDEVVYLRPWFVIFTLVCWFAGGTLMVLSQLD